MTLKTTLTAAVLALIPAISFAGGCSSHEKQVMSCAEGSSYDPSSGSCVTDPVSS